MRAEFAWAPTALRRELEPLISGPIDAAAIEKAARSVLDIQGRVLPAIAHRLGGLAGQLEDAYEEELGRLKKVLPDTGAKRSAEWVVRVLQAIAKIAVQHTVELAEIDIGEATKKASAELAQHEAGWLFSGMTLLMAAMLIADDGGDIARAAELADLAFLNTSRAIDYLSRVGPELDVGALGRVDSRQVVEIFDEAREALAADDLDELSRHRLRDLR
jgi:hypothetical protein